MDVALVSSFEFLRNPIYRVVEDLAIASDGPVYSVILAHELELADLEEIEVDPASLTSVQLLRCLVGPKPRFVNAKESGGKEGARLMIGDQALRFRRENPAALILDLGEAWKTLTQLPFVYALWLVRPEVADPQLIARELRELRDKNLSELEDLIVEACAGAAHEFARFYFRDCLKFSFGPLERRGLLHFRDLCVEHKLLEPGPVELRFV